MNAVCLGAIFLFLQVSVRDALGPPPKPAIKPISSESGLRLRTAVRIAKQKTPSTGVANRAELALADVSVEDVWIHDAPDDPWSDEHKHFLLREASCDAVGIKQGLLLVGVSGRIDGLDRANLPVPILLQISKKGKYKAARGRIAQEPHEDGLFFFEVYNRRMNDADIAMLVFVRPDRTWVMYKDATSGQPKDQFFVAKIDEESLIEAETNHSR